MQTTILSKPEIVSDPLDWKCYTLPRVVKAGEWLVTPGSINVLHVHSNFNGSIISWTMEICSSHRGLIMAPGREANGDNLGNSFSTFYTIIVC